MKFWITILILFLFNSCFVNNSRLTDKRIYKQLVVVDNKAEITIKVDHYSWSKKWFYGSIKILNKTNSIIYFNFNQVLKINAVYVYPYWNIFPISYCPQAFNVLPGGT